MFGYLLPAEPSKNTNLENKKKYITAYVSPTGMEYSKLDLIYNNNLKIAQETIQYVLENDVISAELNDYKHVVEKFERFSQGDICQNFPTDKIQFVVQLYAYYLRDFDSHHQQRVKIIETFVKSFLNFKDTNPLYLPLLSYAEKYGFSVPIKMLPQFLRQICGNIILTDYHLSVQKRPALSVYTSFRRTHPDATRDEIIVRMNLISEAVAIYRNKLSSEEVQKLEKEEHERGESLDCALMYWCGFSEADEIAPFLAELFSPPDKFLDIFCFLQNTMKNLEFETRARIVSFMFCKLRNEKPGNLEPAYAKLILDFKHKLLRDTSFDSAVRGAWEPKLTGKIADITKSVIKYINKECRRYVQDQCLKERIDIRNTKIDFSQLSSYFDGTIALIQNIENREKHQENKADEEEEEKSEHTSDIEKTSSNTHSIMSPEIKRIVGIVDQSDIAYYALLAAETAKKVQKKSKKKKTKIYFSPKKRKKKSRKKKKEHHTLDSTYQVQSEQELENDLVSIGMLEGINFRIREIRGLCSEYDRYIKTNSKEQQNQVIRTTHAASALNDADNFLGSMKEYSEQLTNYANQDRWSASELNTFLLKTDQTMNTARRFLRNTIKLKQKMTDFDTALWAAVEKEPLITGKNWGGVINVKLGGKQKLVEALYHGYEFTPDKKVTIDGLKRKLKDYERLVLYVTYASTSDDIRYCISIRLWRMRDLGTAYPLNWTWRNETVGELNLDKKIDPRSWMYTGQKLAVLHVE